MEASGRITGDGEAPLIVQYRRGICRKASRQIRGILSGREVPFPEQVHIPGSRRQRTASLSQLKPYHDEGTDAKSTNAEGLDTEGVNDTSSNGVDIWLTKVRSPGNQHYPATPSLSQEPVQRFDPSRIRHMFLSSTFLPHSGR